MNQIIVNVNEEKIRLDAYLASVKKELSRTMIKKLIEDGNILVNGKKQKNSYKVQTEILNDY